MMRWASWQISRRWRGPESTSESRMRASRQCGATQGTIGGYGADRCGKSVSIVRITEFARVSVMLTRQASARLIGTSQYFCMKFNTGCRSLVKSNATTGDLRRTAPAIVPERLMAGRHERSALCSAISALLVNFTRDQSSGPLARKLGRRKRPARRRRAGRRFGT